MTGVRKGLTSTVELAGTETETADAPLAMPNPNRLDELAGEIRESQTVLDSDNVKLGRLLNEARALLKRDKEFGQWRSSNTKIDQRTAHRAMELARLSDAAGNSPGQTPASDQGAGILELDARNLLVRDGTKADRNAAIARLQRGEDVTADDAQAIIAARKTAKPGTPLQPPPPEQMIADEEGHGRIRVRIDTAVNMFEDLRDADLTPEFLAEVAAMLFKEARATSPLVAA